MASWLWKQGGDLANGKNSWRWRRLLKFLHALFNYVEKPCHQTDKVLLTGKDIPRGGGNPQPL